jgi:predicted transcriptional regulator
VTDDDSAKFKDEIRARLQQVCSHLSKESFEELVQKIADEERRAAWTNLIDFKHNQETRSEDR